jgi:hypothetical protein
MYSIGWFHKKKPSKEWEYREDFFYISYLFILILFHFIIIKINKIDTEIGQENDGLILHYFS